MKSYKSQAAGLETSSSIETSNITERFRGMSVHGTGATLYDNTSVSNVHERPVASVSESFSHHVYGSNYYSEPLAQTELHSKRMINLSRMLKCVTRQLSELHEDLESLNEVNGGHKIDYFYMKNAYEKFRVDQQSMLDHVDYLVANSQEIVLNDPSLVDHDLIQRTNEVSNNSYIFYEDNKSKLKCIKSNLKFHFRTQFG